MEIKKKFTETKDKVKNWCEEHKQDIRDMCWYAFGATVGGVIFYYTGKHYGFDDGLKEADRRTWARFGKEYGKDVLSQTENVDTGFLDCICTPEFREVMERNCRRIVYDNGNWEFESEVMDK